MKKSNVSQLFEIATKKTAFVWIKVSPSRPLLAFAMLMIQWVASSGVILNNIDRIKYMCECEIM